MLLTEDWSPYTRDDETPWELRRVVHLHRCATRNATSGKNSVYKSRW